MTAAGSLSDRPLSEAPAQDSVAADFFPLVDRAVVDLPEPTPENRDTVYHLARTALDRQLLADVLTEGALDPVSETAALDAAIVRVEAKFAEPSEQALAAEAAFAVIGPASDPAAPTMGSVPPNRRQFAFNAAASGAVSVFKTLLQLALLPVMARLLGPTAYGIYSLAFPTVLFFIMLGDGGLGMSLSREDENNRIVWSTAFWTLLGTCTVLAAGVVGSGFVLAHISGQPVLIGVMGLLSVALPLLAVSVPADARLLRRGNLLYHSGSDLIGTIIGAGVALTLAVRGDGVWALAAQHVTTYAVRAVILNAAAWSPPDLVFDFASLRGHVSTGGALLIGRLGELGSKLAEYTAFGHVFGTAALGSYTLANQVSRFACEAVTNPIVGAFYAQALRETDEEVASLHARLTRMVLLVLLPATALMAVAAPDVFPLILGEKWVAAAPLFQAIVVTYSLAAAAWLSGQILLKHGMADRSAKILIGCGIVRLAVVMTGLWLPAVEVAWLVGATYVLQASVMTLAVPEGFGAGPSTLVAALWGPAAAAAFGALTSAAFIVRFPGSIASAVAASALGLSLYIALLFVIDGPALKADVVGLARVLRRKAA